MNLSQEVFMNEVTNEQADLAMVESISEAMRNKLCKKRNEGFGGWHKPSVITDQALSDMLAVCVQKGDMVDVINVAAMIHVRSELFGNKE